MSIIVDGYNYIGRSQRLKLSDPEARDTIISLFGQYCRRTKKALTLVFDGTYSVNLANRKRQYGRVNVIYTSPTSSADDLIKQMIRERAHGQRQGLLIVTSDAEILQCAKDHNVAWMRSEAFEQTIQRVLAAPQVIDRNHVQLSSHEVQQWLEIFGARDDELESAAPDNTRKTRRKRPEKLSPPPPQPPRQSAETPAVVNAEETPERVSKRRPIPAPSKFKKPLETVEPPEVLDRVHVHLSKDDVNAWLKIFQKSQDENEAEGKSPRKSKGSKKGKKFGK